MENPGSEIHDWDWEVVPSSNTQIQEVVEGPKYFSSSSPSSPSSGGGVIRSDYFTLDYAAMAANDAAVTAYFATVDAVGGSDEGEEGAESDNPSWVDPTGSSVVGGGSRKRSRSPNSNSSSSDCSDRYLMSLIQPHSGCCGGEFECNKDHLGVSEDVPRTPEDHSPAEENEEREEAEGMDQQLLEQSNIEEERKSGEGKMRVVWWKVPLEVLRYCVLRVSPVWSLSMAAAALMGFVILRRRYLYKMKRKSQGIKLNVTLDDKKVSQFMSRAAPLNEAFSVVKRVPIIRPALPAPGMAPWPVMSLR